MISFFVDAEPVAGTGIELDESAVAHARARRVEPGEDARLLDGKGTVALGKIGAVSKRTVLVQVDRVEHVASPAALEVVVPVADRDRMLLAAEKCAELQVTAWTPVMFARSRSVSPRGEGQKFREKVEARMRAALEQSGGAWMPRLSDEAELEEVLGRIETPDRLVLDSSGTSIVGRIVNSHMALMIGPEGGFEPGELRRIRESGWLPTALSTSILRFETAIVAAVATTRALQLGS